MKGNNNRSGFTRIELIAILVAITLAIGFVVAIVQDRNARFHKSARIACLGNMKHVGLSFRVFANENDGHYPMGLSTNQIGSQEWVGRPGEITRHFQVLSNELTTPKVLVCPADDPRAATDFSALNDTNISYFLGLDAEETRPAMLLAGDRNLQRDGVDLGPGVWQLRTNRNITWGPGLHTTKRREGCGNVALADGSVQWLDGLKLQSHLLVTGDATNRIAIP